MQRRTFADGSQTLPVLGLGCSRIGSLGNPTPIAETRNLLDRAVDLGITLFDTADIYGQGDSEREIGRLLRRRRERLFVVTKVGKTFSTKMRLMRPLKPILKPLITALGQGSAVTARRGDAMRADFSPGRLIGAVEAGRRRLGIDTIDAVLLHSPPADALADPALADVFAGLREAGRLRHFGVSCDDLPALEAALALPGVTLLELPLDVLEAAEIAGIGDRIRTAGIGVLAREVVRLRPDLSPPDAVAAAAALPGVTSVVVGTSNRRHLEEIALALP